MSNRRCLPTAGPALPGPADCAGRAGRTAVPLDRCACGPRKSSTPNLGSRQSARPTPSGWPHPGREPPAASFVDHPNTVAPCGLMSRIIASITLHHRIKCSSPRGKIGHRATLPPFGHRLRVDAMTTGQRPQARLTMLYRSTHCRCRSGASVQYLSHKTSHDGNCSYFTPSHCGTKHLLLIWLFQRATRGSVGSCRVQHFRRTCANSSHSSPLRRRAERI